MGKLTDCLRGKGRLFSNIGDHREARGILKGRAVRGQVRASRTSQISDTLEFVASARTRHADRRNPLFASSCGDVAQLVRALPSQQISIIFNHLDGLLSIFTVHFSSRFGLNLLSILDRIGTSRYLSRALLTEDSGTMARARQYADRVNIIKMVKGTASGRSPGLWNATAGSSATMSG
jgi:hypothetical protein